MKVESGPGFGEVAYRDIQPGECYKVHGRLHIKGDYATDKDRGELSIDLATGVCYDYKNDTMVERVHAKVVIGE